MLINPLPGISELDDKDEVPEPNKDFIGSTTSLQDIIDKLKYYGCLDLTASIDQESCSTLPRAGGGFCDVFCGAMDNGTKIAIRTLRVYDTPGKDTDTEKARILKRTARELYHWSKLKHPNVLELMGLAMFRGYLAMICEWMDQGNLTTYIEKNPDTDRMKLCMDICTGLHYIHAIDMVHGDLKAANVMVAPSGVAMIADFGSSQLRNLTLKFSNTTGSTLSLRWAAPELLGLDEESKECTSKKGDVYAYGMTLLEIFTGKIPYSHLNGNQVLIRVAIKREMPTRPESGISDELWEIIQDCWVWDHTKRPHISAIRRQLRAIAPSPLPFGIWSHFAYYNGENLELSCGKRALLVGIEYMDGQKFPDGNEMFLPGCHTDLNDVLELLRNQGEYAEEDIRILADVPGLPESQKPTRDNILEGLRWLSSGCRSGDRRFFYYGGQGTQVEDQDGDENDGLDEAIQPADWATTYEHRNDGLILDDTLRDLIVDPLPRNATLTALIDCCHSGTILDMDREFRAPPPSGHTTTPAMIPATPGIIPRLQGSISSMLRFLTRAQAKGSTEPVVLEPEHSPTTASESVALEMKSVGYPNPKREYNHISANVVCWSACLDSHLAYNQIDDQRGVLTSAFTRGYRMGLVSEQTMPGGLPEKSVVTYAELFDYIREQDRLAYMERLEWAKEFVEFEITVTYQQPQLWISTVMGDIMDQPVVL